MTTEQKAQNLAVALFGTEKINMDLVINKVIDALNEKPLTNHQVNLLNQFQNNSIEIEDVRDGFKDLTMAVNKCYNEANAAKNNDFTNFEFTPNPVKTNTESIFGEIPETLNNADKNVWENTGNNNDYNNDDNNNDESNDNEYSFNNNDETDVEWLNNIVVENYQANEQAVEEISSNSMILEHDETYTEMNQESEIIKEEINVSETNTMNSERNEDSEIINDGFIVSETNTMKSEINEESETEMNQETEIINNGFIVSETNTMKSEINEESETEMNQETEIINNGFIVSETNTIKSKINEESKQSIYEIFSEKKSGVKENTDTNEKKKNNKPTLKKKSTELGSQINVAVIEDKITKNITEIEIHPAVISLPHLSKAEREALEDDIKERGLLNPIIINKKYQCIDGRARLEIMCKNPSVKPLFKIIDISDDEVLEYTVRQNLIRRHLNNGQRAVLAVKIYENIKVQRKNGKEFTFLGIKVGIGERSRKSVAKYFSICETILGKTYTIYKNSPELLDAIMEDSITFEAAYNLATGKPETNKASSEQVLNEVSSEAETNEISTEEYEESEEYGNDTPKTAGIASSDEVQELIRKFEEEKKGKKSSNNEVSQDSRVSARVEFEQKYRSLKPLEVTFLEFLKEDLKMAKSEETLIAMLSKEEEDKSAITFKRTDDESFDKLSQIFMDLVLTEKLSEIEQLNFISMIDQVKLERVNYETMTFEEQVEKLNSNLQDDYKVLLQRAQDQYDEKVKIELNFESTLNGKVFNFIRKCNGIIKQELPLKVA
jgi:ParB-like chromosome segregation protein Spo0J